MNTFIAIITLIVSILQIILFFKIWKMTNNTAEINKKFDVLLKKLASNSVKSIEGELEKDLNSALESDLESGEYEAVDNLYKADKEEDTTGNNVSRLITATLIIILLIGILILIGGIFA